MTCPTLLFCLSNDLHTCCGTLHTQSDGNPSTESTQASTQVHKSTQKLICGWTNCMQQWPQGPGASPCALTQWKAHKDNELSGFSKQLKESTDREGTQPESHIAYCCFSFFPPFAEITGLYFWIWARPRRGFYAIAQSWNNTRGLCRVRVRLLAQLWSTYLQDNKKQTAKTRYDRASCVSEPEHERPKTFWDFFYLNIQKTNTNMSLMLIKKPSTKIIWDQIIIYN